MAASDTDIFFNRLPTTLLRSMTAKQPAALDRVSDM